MEEINLKTESWGVGGNKNCCSANNLPSLEEHSKTYRRKKKTNQSQKKPSFLIGFSLKCLLSCESVLIRS